ncbi:zf-HC2 domain-containing protein [Phytoactinopolyspora limicola]|uniref:zf-HC2 domain-containing protein n=1 Tax=Phytoactinopolyspora limicola TaxID=2715536 RepID=UPI00140DD90F|nr:zf-HC2 domain-containing protein [Phytoactinopolyspora limicola]
MKHLDDRVSDLVDDRLDHEERDRALAHVAGCAHCREAVDMERYAKGVLTSLPDITPPAGLTSTLIGLAEPGGLLPPDDHPSDAAVEVAPWGPSRSTRPDHLGVGTGRRPGMQRSHQPSRPKFIDRHRRGVRVAASGMVSTGALLVLLASLGAPSTNGRDQTPASVVPPMEEFTMEHARSTGGLPFAEPASIIVPALRSVDDGTSGVGTASPGAELPGTPGLGPAGLGWSTTVDGTSLTGDGP